jgi:hypothetical protein
VHCERNVLLRIVLLRPSTRIPRSANHEGNTIYCRLACIPPAPHALSFAAAPHDNGRSFFHSKHLPVSPTMLRRADWSIIQSRRQNRVRFGFGCSRSPWVCLIPIGFGAGRMGVGCPERGWQPAFGTKGEGRRKATQAKVRCGVLHLAAQIGRVWWDVRWIPGYNELRASV